MLNRTHLILSKIKHRNQFKHTLNHSHTHTQAKRVTYISNKREFKLVNWAIFNFIIILRGDRPESTNAFLQGRAFSSRGALKVIIHLIATKD